MPTAQSRRSVSRLADPLLLLDLGRCAEAEAVFRQDLLTSAEIRWSLFGLTRCLEAQGKEAMAVDAQKRFRRACRRRLVGRAPLLSRQTATRGARQGVRAI